MQVQAGAAGEEEGGGAGEEAAHPGAVPPEEGGRGGGGGALLLRGEGQGGEPVLQNHDQVKVQVSICTRTPRTILMQGKGTFKHWPL